MPRVKLDYIVSVSSEDPEYQANNLLAGEVSKKKWLCTKSEQTCSVVLQLARAVTISAVHIGAQHTAFVEVLVGSSEKPNDQYEVLVPRCVFCTPAESRRSEPVPRVRSFSGTQLAEGARRRRWDRVRISCTQPYNKHCQFGLSFIHIFEPERILAQSSTEFESTPSQLSALGVKDKFLTLEKYSSDDDDFRPGELFAKHRQRPTHDNKTAHPSSTDAQIRQASSQALNNISDEATKLKKAHIARSGNKQEDHECVGRSHTIDRGREGYDHAAARPQQPTHSADAARSGGAGEVARKRTREAKQAGGKPGFPARGRPAGREQPAAATAAHRPGTRRENRKRKRSRGDRGDEEVSTRLSECEGAAGQAAEGRVLSGVVFAMSGYVHPERAALRDAALALGARYRPDWAPDCTHLVCAFPNTPKMKKVVAGAAHAHVVSGSWLRECSARRCRVPEAPHSLHAPSALAPASAAAPRARSPDGGPSHFSEQEGDTDDEIEKVRARSRQARKGASLGGLRSGSSPHDLNVVAFVCDERIKAAGSVSLPDSDDETTEEEVGGAEEMPNRDGELPDLLEGSSVLIADEVCAAGVNVAQLARYVRAYGGLPLREEEVEEDATVDYALCASSEGARGLRVSVRGARLRADWLWSCHRARALLPTEPHTLPA